MKTTKTSQQIEHKVEHKAGEQAEMKEINYIEKRGKSYGYRGRIPGDVPYPEGHPLWIVQSLKTKDKKQATLKALEANTFYENLWKELRDPEQTFIAQMRLRPYKEPSRLLFDASGQMVLEGNQIELYAAGRADGERWNLEQYGLSLQRVLGDEVQAPVQQVEINS